MKEQYDIIIISGNWKAYELTLCGTTIETFR